MAMPTASTPTATPTGRARLDVVACVGRLVCSVMSCAHLVGARARVRRPSTGRPGSRRTLEPMMGAMSLPLQPPLAPMLAKLADEIPDGDGWLYEPKWDGFRCIVFRDGDDIELASRNERPFTRYFPELLEPLLRRRCPSRCVVDGEIVVPAGDDRGLDFDALLQRIHPAESRVRRLAAETPAVVRRLRPAGPRRRRRCSTRRSPSATALLADAAALDAGAARVPVPEHHRRRRRPTLVRRVRGRRPRRRRRQAARRSVHARQAHADQGQAPTHRRLRRRRLPDPQGRQGRRLAAARPVRRRGSAAPRRRGRLVHASSGAPSCSPSWSR